VMYPYQTLRRGAIDELWTRNWYNSRATLFGKVALDGILHLTAQIFQHVGFREDGMPYCLRLEAAFRRLAHHEDNLLDSLLRHRLQCIPCVLGSIGAYTYAPCPGYPLPATPALKS